MSLQVTGKIKEIYATQQVNDKFKKREFVLELAEEVSGQTYTNYAKFQAVQNRCDVLDRFNVGDTVTVDFNIKGNSYVDKKDGSTKYITNLDVWKVTAANGGGAQQAEQVQSVQPTVDTSTNDRLPF